MCKILLIIPAYNESEGIASVVQTVKTYIATSHYALDYIVINDGSTDKEEQILQENEIQHIELVQNLGLTGALLTGYRYALENNFDIAVQYDGDGQHDIHSLPALIEPLLTNKADYTVGSRYTSDSPSAFKSSAARQVGMKLLTTLVKAISKIEIKDITSGYTAAKRDVFERLVKGYSNLRLEAETYVYLNKKGFRIKEVGVTMFERTTGKSSISPLKGIAYMFSVSAAVIYVALFQKGD
ncbi:MAG: glycosyltransferase family 2 protein [Streptococcaceae bacterium]|jgi:glycosyltransferase involved in cell wall biosynthesis|nr:glycosyltransferase family 2 protein [Streptococcaceae bacterium]